MALGDVLQPDPARLAVFGQFHRTGDEPLASAFADRVPRRTMLVALNLTRATVAVALPFVTEVWQVYVLIFLLQAASAGFTPTFQATIPDVLPDEADYTRALSLSRLA